MPAAQAELDQKVQQLYRKAYHAEAFGCAELIMCGMKMKAIREIAENSELLKLKGFNRLEDFFESLGLKRSTGFVLKKIAETFSEEKVQLLDSMGVSQRGILRLTCLPPEQLSKIKETEDPQELKSMCEDLFADIEKRKKEHKALLKMIDDDKGDIIRMKKRLDAFERLYPEDDAYWVAGNRPIHSQMWETCLREIKAFALNDRAVNNSEALEYLREFYDRIVGNLFDLNEEFKAKNAGLSFVRAKK